MNFTGDTFKPLRVQVIQNSFPVLTFQVIEVVVNINYRKLPIGAQYYLRLN